MVRCVVMVVSTNLDNAERFFVLPRRQFPSTIRRQSGCHWDDPCRFTPLPLFAFANHALERIERPSADLTFLAIGIVTIPLRLGGRWPLNRATNARSLPSTDF
jgi:hypothetical protein